ncbi:MAG: hypothetical protein KAU31_12700 [Spirochaetaceae bacterium]|nr:hypothetical protein [Spirochaetaceae bacterium]
MPSTYKDVPHLAHEDNAAQSRLPVEVSRRDRKTLRALGRTIAEIAQDPINTERAELWSKLNDLKQCRPMVWLNEVCWNEMTVDRDLAEELDLQCESEFCRRIEIEFRQTIFQWQHMQADMVVEPKIYAPLIVSNSGLGIETKEDTIASDPSNEVVSHRFIPQIQNEEDIEKIELPRITHHAGASRETLEAYREILDGVVEVEQIGSPGFWFAPWDVIVGWTGVEQVLLDLAMRPDYVHRLVDRLTNAYLHALDQFEDQGLLSLNNRNVRVGSGAYGYTGELPGNRYDADHPKCRNLWGSATPQIFAEVSPSMHEEFALQYEQRWLERFGLTYYGCCEPLHKKVEILRSIPNLRKLSTSPWADIEEMAETVGRDYVLSIKPNPALLATDSWDLESARADLMSRLDVARRHDCSVEVIMKDISTVRYEPHRLFEWTKMGSEVCRKHQ